MPGPPSIAGPGGSVEVNVSPGRWALSPECFPD